MNSGKLVRCRLRYGRRFLNMRILRYSMGFLWQCGARADVRRSNDLLSGLWNTGLILAGWWVNNGL